jgi:hypothetical protein
LQEPNNETKILIAQVSQVITNALQNDEKMLELFQLIRDRGFEMTVAAEVTVGLHVIEDFEPSEAPAPGPELVTPKTGKLLKFSPQDSKFLKTMRISLDDK